MHARGKLLGVSSLHHVGSRDEIRPSGLVANAFTTNYLFGHIIIML